MDKKAMEKKLIEIMENNYHNLGIVGFDQSRAKNLFTISHNDTNVFDFLHDETMRDIIQPIKYYGLEKLENVIKLYDEYNRIMDYIECSESIKSEEGMHHFLYVHPSYIDMVFNELKRYGNNVEYVTRENNTLEILLIDEIEEA